MRRSNKTGAELLYPRLELKPGTEAWATIAKMIQSPPSELLELAMVSELDDMLEYGNVGGKASKEDCEAIAKGLVKIATNHGFPKAPSNDQKRAADSEMAIFLHENMRLTRNEAAHEGVWNALSCYFCPAVVSWRWSEQDDDSESIALDSDGNEEVVSVSERWFTQSKSERHAFGRLWWRAELLRDEEAEDPYHIIQGLMEDEQVQCTERGLFVTHREAVIALARKHLSNTKTKARMELFRQAIKNLRRMASIIDLDAAASNGSLDTMVDKCYSEAKRLS